MIKRNLRIVSAPALLILFVLPTILVGCNNNGTTDIKAADASAIRTISAIRAKAFNDGDAATIASYFSADCFLMAPGGPAKRSPKEVEAYYQGIFDIYHTKLESTYEEVKVDGKLAFGRGIARVTLRKKTDNTIQISTAKYLNILEKKEDGKWLTTHDIWNNNE